MGGHRRRLLMLAGAVGFGLCTVSVAVHARNGATVQDTPSSFSASCKPLPTDGILTVRFNEAADRLTYLFAVKHETFGQDEMEKIYGLFKQANCGDNKAEEPWSFELKAHAKWQ